eukprot:TRINITY_DN277_c0_g1_i1.p1 TRINITY_DN277_c0_g1~~TRINITY_DN277_c0_g1_i1.p1  ORF type:complete len:303 (+),score=99.45 TRINITY_DN277_c0_g1_i1:178-1086(+)
MKFNISYPINGTQKCVEIDDEQKVSLFYDRRMGVEVAGDQLGDQFKGYIFKISGGNDRDGFPMKQGVLVKGRVRLLLSKGHSCYIPKRTGERKRKSVRGCIVGSDIKVLALTVVKKGEAEIEGLTDAKQPRRLGPKRANHIRKLFALTKQDDVRRYVVRRSIPGKDGKKPRVKAPKIQRLITDVRLRRKRIYKREKKQRWLNTRKATEEYHKVCAEYRKQKEQKRVQTEEAKKATQQPAQTQPQKTQAPAQAAGKGAKGAQTAAQTKAAPAQTKQAQTKPAQQPQQQQAPKTAAAPAKKQKK